MFYGPKCGPSMIGCLLDCIVPGEKSAVILVCVPSVCNVFIFPLAVSLRFSVNHWFSAVWFWCVFLYAFLYVSCTLWFVKCLGFVSIVFINLENTSSLIIQTFFFLPPLFSSPPGTLAPHVLDHLMFPTSLRCSVHIFILKERSPFGEGKLKIVFIFR